MGVKSKAHRLTEKRRQGGQVRQHLLELSEQKQAQDQELVLPCSYYRRGEPGTFPLGFAYDLYGRQCRSFAEAQPACLWRAAKLRAYNCCGESSRDAGRRNVREIGLLHGRVA